MILVIHTKKVTTQKISKISGFPYLEFCVEGLRFKKVDTNTTVTIDASLDSIKTFVFDPYEFVTEPESDSYSQISGYSSSTAYVREIQQVLIVSGPEPTEKQ